MNNFTASLPNSYVSLITNEQTTGSRGCGCQGLNVFRRPITRTCKLRNAQLRVPPECNAVDILAIEKGTTTFALQPAPEPPLSIVVNPVPPVAGVPRVFPTRGNFAPSTNYTPM